MTVRVRFAPSPTGNLHIGNARAAIINYLFAKKHGGEFLLRLDDTDLERSKEEYTQGIFRDLEWLGLTHDQFEKQSARFGRYDEIVAELKKSGRLYPCYETQEELEFKRKRQLGKGLPPIYDRAALDLTPDQIKAYEDEGRKPHWRFKLLPGTIAFNDLVRGHVEYGASRLSDPVLIRADGAYLYTITSVVDDIDFEITHILRGEDHVTNTAVQVQLFEAITGVPTSIKFGHTTLLMDEKGQPLSKRLGSLSLGDMKNQGIEPMAICSLMARLGTSMPVEPFHDLLALAQTFDLSTFSRTPPHFNPEDLNILTHKVLQIMPFREIESRLSALGVNISEPFWDLLRGNLSRLEDIKDWQKIIEGPLNTQVEPEDKEYIEQAAQCLPPEPWGEETWAQWTGALKEITGRKGKQLFMPLRRAITGLDHGPEIKDLLTLIGYARVRERLLG